MKEADFQSTVIQLAERTGWAALHVIRSMSAKGRWMTTTSLPGWPDLTLIRPPELIFAELKGPKGRIRPEQEQVLDLLAQLPGVEVYIWKPKDMAEIEKRLMLRKIPEPKLWPFCRVDAHQRCTALEGACTCPCHQEGAA